MQMAMYTGKRPSPTKGMKYGPRPDDWDNPLMLDASAREKIVSLYKSGMSAPNVAKEVGAAKSTVLRHLRAADVEIRGAIKALDTKEIKRRHAEGETVRQLSADYDVAPSTILRRLRSRDEKYA